MIVAAVIFAASGLLLTMDANGWTLGGAALLGALLAGGYLDKTAMLPVGVLYALSSIALAEGASLAILLHFGVHLEGRLIAAPLTVLVVTVLASFTFAHARTGRLVAAACVAAAIGTSGPYFAGAFYGTLKDMRGGERRIVDPAWTIAEELRTRGFRSGDRVAVIGNDYDVTWAQRAELTIVGELSSDQLGAYLGADAPVRQHVVDAFRTLGVRGVIARSTSRVFDSAPWARIPATEFSVLEQAGP